MEKILKASFKTILSLSVCSCILIACANQKEVDRAEKMWREYHPPRIQNHGSTKILTVLPLIDYYASNSELMGEPGVSYLIRTDQNTILFDVGFNQEKIDPSPLQHNMKQLGITIQDFDTIVITHNHPDHVGGFGFMDNKTFSLANEQIDLAGKRVFTPIPMTYPGLNPVCSKEPTIIGQGAVSIGTIPRQLFIMGWTEEQALAINVEGKGIVIIIGCGHQTVEKILERTERIFSEPIYGIIGGLHYPVPDGRIRKFGLDVQPIVSTESPFNRVTMENVMADIERIQAHKPAVVGLSPHDSSDEAIEKFREAFGTAYRELRVGEPITIGGGKSESE